MNMGYKPSTILSSNRKTIVPSLNLTRANCRPSELCKTKCYARQGHMILTNAEKKQRWVSEYLLGDDMSQLIGECKGHTAVRLCGGGDLLPNHIPNLFKVAKACPDTMFWGFTRKPEIAEVVNSKRQNLYLSLTVDHTTPKKVWGRFEGDIAFGPRVAGAEVPNDDRIKVVFPYHFSGRVVNGVPHHPKDCLAVWDHITHCIDCKRCYPESGRGGD